MWRGMGPEGYAGAKLVQTTRRSWMWSCGQWRTTEEVRRGLQGSLLQKNTLAAEWRAHGEVGDWKQRG